MERIPADVLARPIQGLHLTGGTLAEELPAQGTTLLLFLRHLG